MTTKPKAAKPAKKPPAKKTASDKPKRTGRPKGSGSLYTPELAAEICARLSKGEPMAQISRDKGMPCAGTLHTWKQERKDFAEMFARARLEGFDQIALDALRIADTQVEGVEITIDDMGKTTEKRSDMLGHRKLQVETRLKLLAKWDPKRYGDRVALDADVTVKRAAAEMTDEELLAIATKKAQS
jgi:hypothetical protein